MTYNPFSLIGKMVLVTGASSGIGRATAIECSKMGATLCITGRNIERLHETFLQLEGKKHRQFIADLTHEKQIESLVNSLPKLDGIVHSAGIIPNMGTLSVYIETDEMIDLFRSNVLHVIHLNSLLMQFGKLKSEASIIHISSYSANRPSLGLSMYCITKSALATYSKTLAAELAYKKIRVNTLFPAMIDTETVMNITEDNPHFVSDRASYPFGYGKPEDVAWASLYLLSDAARWITGSEFTLDGGHR